MVIAFLLPHFLLPTAVSFACAFIEITLVFCRLVFFITTISCQHTLRNKLTVALVGGGQPR